MKTSANVYSSFGYGAKVLVPLTPSQVVEKVKEILTEKGFTYTDKMPDRYSSPTNEVANGSIWENSVYFFANSHTGEKALVDALWSLVPEHKFYTDPDKLRSLCDIGAERAILNRWEYSPKVVFTLDKAFELSGGYIVRNEYKMITDISLPGVTIDKSLWRKLPKNIILNAVTGKWSFTGNEDIDKVLRETFNKIID